MPVAERDYLREENGNTTSFFSRLALWAERNPKLVTFLITALLIIIVISIINYYRKQSQVKMAEQAINDAMQTEFQLGLKDAIKQLEGAKASYASTPALPKILYHLANKYHEAGMLDEAKKTYEEFIQNYPDHLLSDPVKRAYQTLLTNREWLEHEKSKSLAGMNIDTNPLKVSRSGVEQPIGRVGPVKAPNTVVDVETSKGRFTCELFDNEAPNTVANIMKLVEKNFYNGVKFSLVNTDERLAPDVGLIQAGIAYYLPIEINSRDAAVGSIVIAKNEQGDANAPAAIQILLKPLPSLKEKTTILGIVTEGMDNVRKLTKDDSITKITATKKRTSYPEPQIIKKK